MVMTDTTTAAADNFATDQCGQDTLQAHFLPDVSADDIAQVFQLKRAQPLLQVFTALFHGGFDGVLVRLLVLRELAFDSSAPAYTRAEINLKLAYLLPESLETVLLRLRSHGLLAWDAQQGVYRVTPMARNVLSAIDSLQSLGKSEDEAEMGFLLSQVAGAQAVGGVTVAQLQHLLGRLIDLTEEFGDAIASGSEFRLRAAQEKWNMACDWVEKGSQIMRAILQDADADVATHKAAQEIGRAQSKLLNMQGMFSRALGQIERQRVHLGQSGLSTTDIKRWLLQHPDLAQLADGVLEQSVLPLFATPAEMIDVAETELLAERSPDQAAGLPDGQDAVLTADNGAAVQLDLEAWLARLSGLAGVAAGPSPEPIAVHAALLPASFAIASYRASLLPLLGGDAAQEGMEGAAAQLARLPVVFEASDRMIALQDPHVAAMSVATLMFEHDVNLSPEPASDPPLNPTPDPTHDFVPECLTSALKNTPPDE
ncbi:MAG: hypothetical protein ACI83P_001845 [Janthinobacterium sp.]|jgi:hypothetical protein